MSRVALYLPSCYICRAAGEANMTRLIIEDEGHMTRQICRYPQELGEYLDLIYQKPFQRRGQAAFSHFPGSKETMKKLAVRVWCRRTLTGQRRSMPMQVL